MNLNRKKVGKKNMAHNTDVAKEKLYDLIFSPQLTVLRPLMQ